MKALILISVLAFSFNLMAANEVGEHEEGVLPCQAGNQGPRAPKPVTQSESEQEAATGSAAISK